MRKVGTVVQIKNKFYARWRVNGKDEFGEARSSWHEAETDRLRGRPPKSDLTLQEWAYNYALRLKGAETSRATEETIRLKHLEGSKLGGKKLTRITRTDCQEWVDTILVYHETKDSAWLGPPSPSYRRRVAAYGSKLMGRAVKEGLAVSNPFTGLDLPEVEERENRTLSPEEVVKLLNPQTRTDTLILVAVMTGLRRSELLRLEWPHVSESLIKAPGTKSRRAKRGVPITPEVYAAIQALPKRSRYVFTTESGKPLSPRNVTRDFNRRKIELGIPKEVRLHDLRGTLISLLVEQNEDFRTIMELAGHSDVRTTMKSYARSRQKVKEDAILKLRERIRG